MTTAAFDKSTVRKAIKDQTILRVSFLVQHDAAAEAVGCLSVYPEGVVQCIGYATQANLDYSLDPATGGANHLCYLALANRTADEQVSTTAGDADLRKAESCPTG